MLPSSQNGKGIGFPDYSKPVILWDKNAPNNNAGTVTAPGDGVLYISMHSDGGYGHFNTNIYDQTGTIVAKNRSDRSSSNTTSFIVKKGDIFTYTVGWVEQIVFYPFIK